MKKYILMEKDIISADKAKTPCEFLYFLIQLLYLENKKELRTKFIETYQDIYNASPSLREKLLEIKMYVDLNDFYKSLKLTKKILPAEKIILERAID